jgi:hypothetical protein
VIVVRIHESIANLADPHFKPGAISGLVITEKEVLYGEMKMNTWKIPTVFVSGFDVEVRGTESFINNRVLGNPEPDFNRKYLHVFPTDKLTELSKEDFKNLDIGVE